MEAAWYNSKEVAGILIAAKANLDAQSRDGRTALMEAAENGHIEVAQVLLDGGCNVDIRSKVCNLLALSSVVLSLTLCT